jgi:Protein of unknown function (DUF1638)
MSVLVVACGALAAELRAVLAGVDDVEVRFLPANLHNRPGGIVPAVRDVIDHAGDERHVFVAYADCGTGGGLDAFIAEHPAVTRLPGAHCYEAFAGTDRFASLHDEEPGTFYLTDFLAKHFDALVWGGLGLDRHPELLAAYFGNYRRVVWLAQRPDAATESMARRAADLLGLPLRVESTELDVFGRAVSVGIRRAA